MGQPDPIFATVSICERMGWTYDEYQDQPDLFINAVSIKIGVEARMDRERARAERSKLG